MFSDKEQIYTASVSNFIYFTYRIHSTKKTLSSLKIRLIHLSAVVFNFDKKHCNRKSFLCQMGATGFLKNFLKIV